RHGLDLASMRPQGGNRLPVAGVPETQHLVRSAGDEDLSVRTVGDARHGSLVTIQSGDLLTIRGVEDLDAALLTRTDNLGSIRTQCEGADRVGQREAPQ